ncbi:ataxin-2 homolog isoform X2 [Triticum aestivum]|nr:ataxin-2 homolog isoform X2 [Triticum aestivum]
MEDQRMDYAMAYPPGPHPETLYMRPVARTVTFSGTNSVHMIPPNPPPPQQQQQQQHPEPQAPSPQQQAPPPQHVPQPQPEQPAPAPEQGPPPADQQPRQPKRGKKKPPRRVRFGPEPPPPQQQQQQEHQEQQQQQEQQPEHAPNGNPGSGAPGHHGQQGRGPPGYLRYTPSPLPRWEATPRRHEYFSGEYRYSYPTPVREGIYSMATDANRLTTIFSEENPNACAIV